MGQNRFVKITPTVALDFNREALRIGRNNGPALLADWIADGRLGRDDVRRVLTTVWEMAEFPQRALGVQQWVHLFRWVGFVQDDDDEAVGPKEPLVVYRGAGWGGRRGMAWTTDPSRAQWFASRIRAAGPEAHVFKTSVPPDAVLALIGHDPGLSRGECEVVVDPSLLPPIGRRAITGL